MAKAPTEYAILEVTDNGLLRLHDKTRSTKEWNEALEQAARDGESDGLPRTATLFAIPLSNVHGRTFTKSMRPQVETADAAFGNAAPAVADINGEPRVVVEDRVGLAFGRSLDL